MAFVTLLMAHNTNIHILLKYVCYRAAFVETLTNIFGYDIIPIKDNNPNSLLI